MDRRVRIWVDVFWPSISVRAEALWRNARSWGRGVGERAVSAGSPYSPRSASARSPSPCPRMQVTRCRNLRLRRPEVPTSPFRSWRMCLRKGPRTLNRQRLPPRRRRRLTPHRSTTPSNPWKRLQTTLRRPPRPSPARRPSLSRPRRTLRPCHRSRFLRPCPLARRRRRFRGAAHTLRRGSISSRRRSISPPWRAVTRSPEGRVGTASCPRRQAARLISKVTVGIARRISLVLLRYAHRMLARAHRGTAAGSIRALLAFPSSTIPRHRLFPSRRRSRSALTRVNRRVNLDRSISRMKGSISRRRDPAKRSPAASPSSTPCQQVPVVAPGADTTPPAPAETSDVPDAVEPASSPVVPEASAVPSQPPGSAASANSTPPPDAHPIEPAATRLPRRRTTSVTPPGAVRGDTVSEARARPARVVAHFPRRLRSKPSPVKTLPQAERALAVPARAATSLPGGGDPWRLWFVFGAVALVGLAFSSFVLPARALPRVPTFVGVRARIGSKGLDAKAAVGPKRASRGIRYRD